MKSVRRRFWVIVSIFAFFTALSLAARPPKNIAGAGAVIAKLPLTLGEWRGKEIPVDEKTKALLETDGVMMRSYDSARGGSVVLAVVYYRGNHVALHLPESCLMGKGSRLVHRAGESVDCAVGSVSCTKLITAGDAGKHVILYYFQSGGLCTNNYARFRKSMIMDSFRGASPGGALVRVSCAGTGRSDDDVELLKSFVRVLAPELGSIMEKAERQGTS